MPTAPKIPPLRPRHTPPPRGTTTQRGYGHAHRRARERQIVEHPVCQHCDEAWATDLHHIDGDPHNRRPDNLLMVCEACHHGAIHGR